YRYEEDVISHVDWIIGPGDRIGILGKNGAGKTTLLELMCADLEPTQGRVRIGKTVRFGVLSQRLETFEDRGDWTVYNILARAKSHVMIDGKDTSSEKLLERLGFSRPEFMSRVDELSGGQKRRLALLLVLLDEPNVLLLDEPGNDLDTDMLAAVEDLLDSWPGTLIVVTHDRFLIERVTDDLFALVDGHVQHLPRGVDEYLEIMAEDRGGQAQTSMRSLSADSSGNRSDESGRFGERPMGNAERRELRKRFDSLTRRLPRAQEAPKLAEARLKACDPTDFEELMRLQAELDRALEELDAMEMEWLELSELFE
ncbi:MAG: ABC-F family ATP-binding cassette domain-containing protein, partial [Atopobiaceae bacterium]|nr:ABC-F family ATP-binding cassette domain-containing protein [Atopobiaceae bacterium]